MACNNLEKTKEKVVVFSVSNNSEREKKISFEMTVDSSFLFFSQLLYSDIPDEATVFRLKTQNERIKINLEENYFSLKLDTLINLEKDTSHILVQFTYLPDTTRLKKFNKAGLEVDSLIIKTQVPRLSLKRMDYW
ncbi:hypothetical protein ACFPIB_12100 [Adhaeribacter terreus]|uniref:Uncharacterized protein n=2 Tax=Adhaeribacter terreus TaxID=529703 RepID=A0ABW0EAF4_9BACT